MFNNKANVEMIPMIIYIFILVIILFTIAFVVAPITSFIDDLAVIMDPAGSIYSDIPAKFDQSVSIWYFLLVIMIVIKLAHFGLLAIKKQKTEGTFANESDFR